MHTSYPRILLTAALTATLAFAHSHDGEPHFETTEVAPNIYMLQGVGGFLGGNIGISIGEDGVVMIDDSMPPYLDKLTHAISSVTDQPIDFLINTHIHGDHIGNNATFGEQGVRLVAHDRLRSRLVEQGIRMPDGFVPAPDDALPEITFSEDITFHLNGQTTHVFHVPQAHTDGDAIIHFKEANVIHGGDVVFHGLFPYIDLDSGGSVDGFIAGLAKIISLCDDETKVIPGHGPLTDKMGVQLDLDMLMDAKARVAALIAEGHSIDDIVATEPLKDYEDGFTWGFINAERLTRTIHRDLTSS